MSIRFSPCSPCCTTCTPLSVSEDVVYTLNIRNRHISNTRWQPQDCTEVTSDVTSQFPLSVRPIEEIDLLNPSVTPSKTFDSEFLDSGPINSYYQGVHSFSEIPETQFTFEHGFFYVVPPGVSDDPQIAMVNDEQSFRLRFFGTIFNLVYYNIISFSDLPFLTVCYYGQGACPPDPECVGPEEYYKLQDGVIVDGGYTTIYELLSSYNGMPIVRIITGPNLCTIDRVIFYCGGTSNTVMEAFVSGHPDGIERFVYTNLQTLPLHVYPFNIYNGVNTHKLGGEISISNSKSVVLLGNAFRWTAYETDNPPTPLFWSYLLMEEAVQLSSMAITDIWASYDEDEDE